MNPKTQKLRAELEKNTEKIGKLQARNAEIKQQIQEQENLEILGMVRQRGLTPDMLAGVLASIQPASENEAMRKEREEHEN